MTRKRGEEGELFQIGEIPMMKTLAKKYKPATRAQLELIEAAEAIRAQPDAAEKAYMARQLVLCTLPHSDPGDVPVWSRRTGNFSLAVQPGYSTNPKTGLLESTGYPFGTIPRLLLFWIITEAVQKQQKRLILGRSLAEFMRQVGLDPNGGGKRSDHRRLKQQMHRLFKARISFEEISLDKARWLNMDVAPEGELWWHPHEPEQSALFESWIDLGEKFFEAIRATPVPVDTRALKALKSSALALDLYALLCLRAFVIVKNDLEPQFLSWEQLRQQLGTGHSNAKDFKAEAKAALAKIQRVYEGLTLQPARGGFIMHATRLAVPQKASGKLTRD